MCIVTTLGGENVTLKEIVALKSREQTRLMVINQIEKGRYKGVEAARILNLSLRQIRRLTSDYLIEGAAALSHGNRDRKPVNAIDERQKQAVIDFYRGEFTGFTNPPCRLPSAS
jgi:hypothetical protein